jgi:iron complex outermembrane receptor protein
MPILTTPTSGRCARLLLASAALVLAGVKLAHAAADPAPASDVEKVVVKAKRLLLKEKNSPSAVTELGHAQIAQEGTTGSTETLLRQAPSVYVYQEGPGENAPVFSIRGVRGLEVAETFDDVPMQDLLNGGRTGIIGSRFTLDQIDSASIYPGVAYPDKNTFGTIGGTIAFTPKQPEKDFSVDLFGSVGSFNTYETGLVLNTGALDGLLGTGDNAPRVLLTYTNLQTGGYIDDTAARYGNLMFDAVKPYDDGLSTVEARILYNTGNGAPLSEPTPTPVIAADGPWSNFPDADVRQRENDKYYTAILKDKTYINDYINVGVTAFYLGSDQTYTAYESADFLDSNAPQPYTGIPWNNQGPGVFGIGQGGYYLPGYFTYNPAVWLNNPKYCSAAAASYGSASPCGLNSENFFTHTDTYGIRPTIDILLDQQAIKLGGLLAKETQPTPTSFVGGAPNIVDQPGYNQFQPNGYNGGSQRTIYQLFAQDKVDFFDNTLHITPGATLEGTYSSNHADNFAFTCQQTGPYCNDNQVNSGAIAYVPSYKLHKFDRDTLPFFNVTYDLDKILPNAAGTSVYASYGTSALFAPATDFISNATGSVPAASIVHMYEVGVKYDTSKLLLSLDYFYQKVDRDFGFYEGSGPDSGANIFTNSGQREFKGFETAFAWQATPNLTFAGNGSYVLAHYLVTDLAFSTIGEDQYGFAIKGSPISGVPSFLGNLSADYHIKDALRDDDAFSARLSMQYTGPQYETYDLNEYATVPGFGGGGNQISEIAGATVTNTNAKLNEFTTLNLLLSYTLPTPSLPVKHVVFDLNLQNILDRRYDEYYYSQIPDINGTYLTGAYQDALPGQPFSVTFTTTVRF